MCHRQQTGYSCFYLHKWIPNTACAYTHLHLICIFRFLWTNFLRNTQYIPSQELHTILASTGADDGVFGILCLLHFNSRIIWFFVNYAGEQNKKVRIYYKHDANTCIYFWCMQTLVIQKRYVRPYTEAFSNKLTTIGK